MRFFAANQSDWEVFDATAVLKEADKLVLEDVPIPEPGLARWSCASKAVVFVPRTTRRSREFVKRGISARSRPRAVGHCLCGGTGRAPRGRRRCSDLSTFGLLRCPRPLQGGQYHYCDHAFTTGGDGPEDVWPGAFAEYMKTTESVCAKPESISFDARR